jgi:branched-chain amino acid aminotransferase
VNGVLLPAEEAQVSVLDHGFTVGDGVFETLRTAHDPVAGVVPFARDRHIARLAASAAGLGLPAPDPDQVREAVHAVCAANPELAQGGRLRVTYTAGPGPLGSARTPGRSTLAVAASPAGTWPPTATLALSPWPRNECSPLAGLKTTSYAENVKVLAHAHALGAGEALLANLAGDICEGTGSNVFLVRGGHIMTPPLSSGCLAGITRALVLQWCADAGIEVVEMAQPMSGITASDEIFISSSTRDVHPVASLLDASGGLIWSADSAAAGAGPVTHRVAALFARRALADWNP